MMFFLGNGKVKIDRKARRKTEWQVVDARGAVPIGECGGILRVTPGQLNKGKRKLIYYLEWMAKADLFFGR